MTIRLTADERDELRRRIDAARREAENVKPKIADGERRCFGCDEIKSLDEFCKSKRHSKGRSYQCRACKRRYASEREREIRANGGEAYEALKRRRTEALRRYRTRRRAETRDE